MKNYFILFNKSIAHCQPDQIVDENPPPGKVQADAKYRLGIGDFGLILLIPA